MKAKTDIREIDQDHRNRMRDALDANIAVRAAAGSGKTRSTVDRIVRMALDPTCRDFLPQLVVVTYTNAAADELRTRARKRLIEEHHTELKKHAGDIIPKFGQIFFGTIHSFCMRILSEFGYLAGLPAELESLEEQVQEIHDRFRREREDRVWDSLNRAEVVRVFRHGLTFDELVKMGRDLSVLPIDCAEFLEESGLNRFGVESAADAIRLDPAALDEIPLKAHSAKSIEAYRKKYRAFCNIWNGGESAGSIQMIEAAKQGGREIEERTPILLAPVHDWFARSVLKLGMLFAAEFQAYRWQKGCLTFNDQILLAARVIAEPTALKTLRSRNLRVILDEAQDTTPLQFRILSELARPVEAVFGEWPSNSKAHPPRPGSFVMVGDAQQCIYASSGANISCYLRHGEAIEPAVFQVTFRCDRAVIEFVNNRFPRILDGREGQAQFVELAPRQNAGEGRLGRLTLDARPVVQGGRRPTDTTLFRSEAEMLAARIKQLGFRGLGARCWSDIAVLMPRNKWLSVLAGCMEREAIPCRMTARRKNRDDAGWRWFTALLVTLARGDDGYELAGVLREIFGIADGELAAWSFAGGKFDLGEKPPEGGPARVAQSIQILRDLRRRMGAMPALAAVHEMIDATGLSERIESLKQVPGLREISTRMLGVLRGRASQAEAMGVGWRELAEELASEGEMNMPEVLPSEGRDGIVLMTCQKAKGQEWPVVILPGLSRPIWPAGRQDKVIELLGAACKLKGVSTSDWEQALAARGLAEDQQMRRTYYVACTRAKEHLILVDARGLWKAGVNYKFIRPIQAMSAPGESDAWIDRIGEWSAPAGVLDRGVAVPKVEVGLTDWNEMMGAAKVQTIRPSQQDEDRSDPALDDLQDRSERDLRVEPLHGALIYGNWWHETMFWANWAAADIADRLKLKIDELPIGELRQRGRREIDSLVKSELYQELTLPGVRFHRELPYARVSRKNAIEDGKIDLVYRSGETWNVVDWKTDVVRDPAEATARASDRYSAQLHTYVEALRSFDVPVAGASLYFTAIGETVKAE